MILKTLIFTLILSLSNLAFLQEEGKIQLYKFRNGKEKMVKYSKVDEINLIESEANNVMFSNIYYVGDIVGEDEGNIQINPWYYYESITYEGNNMDSVVTMTKDYYLFEEESPIIISKDQIESLSYSPPAKYYGYGFAYASFMSALMVAPLVSLKTFNKGTFNTSRYLNVAKYSLLGVAAGISFSLFFPDRTYTFKPRF